MKTHREPLYMYNEHNKEESCDPMKLFVFFCNCAAFFCETEKIKSFAFGNQSAFANRE